MLFSDTYNTIADKGKGEFKDRGSRFLGFAYRVASEEDAKTHLQQLKKEYYNAAHHCYALVLGADKEIQKFHDDREPANTAGRPILRTILSKDLTFVSVFVIRYFGGKLLGVPGLIHAYGEAATAALEDAGTAVITITERYELTASTENENEIFRLIKQFGLKVLQHHHGNEIRVIFEVKRSMTNAVLESIQKNHLLKIKYIPG